MPAVFQPTELGDAVALLARGCGDMPPLLPIAGGTDIWPAQVGRALASPLLDLSGIHAMAGIDRINHDDRPAIRIGALTRWCDLARRRPALLADPLFDGLAAAAAEVGGEQIQNRGTLGGNLCHASPAADGVPALLALDAQLMLRSASGARTLPLAAFICGARRTRRRADELLEAILVPLPSARYRRSVFLKLGHRRYLVISAVMVAVTLGWDEDETGSLALCRIAVGACAPTAQRLHGIEHALIGMKASDLARWSTRPGGVDAAAMLAPIDDVRGSRHWRLEMVDTLVRRAIAAALPGATARGGE